jgi:hypothetical protein
MKSNNWIPEIMYEDSPDDGLTSHIPFIPVPKNEEMPKMLFIFESRETGEFEPGPTGEDLAVTEMELYQYVDMSVLKRKLQPEVYDLVRAALDLEPLQTAAQKGAEITNNIRLNIGKQTGVFPDGTKIRLQ